MRACTKEADRARHIVQVDVNGGGAVRWRDKEIGRGAGRGVVRIGRCIGVRVEVGGWDALFGEGGGGFSCYGSFFEDHRCGSLLNSSGLIVGGVVGRCSRCSSEVCGMLKLGPSMTSFAG